MRSSCPAWKPGRSRPGGRRPGRLEPEVAENYVVRALPRAQPGASRRPLNRTLQTTARRSPCEHQSAREIETVSIRASPSLQLFRTASALGPLSLAISRSFSWIEPRASTTKRSKTIWRASASGISALSGTSTVSENFNFGLHAAPIEGTHMDFQSDCQRLRGRVRTLGPRNRSASMSCRTVSCKRLVPTFGGALPVVFLPEPPSRLGHLPEFLRGRRKPRTVRRSLLRGQIRSGQSQCRRECRPLGR